MTFKVSIILCMVFLHINNFLCSELESSQLVVDCGKTNLNAESEGRPSNRTETPW
jgi:hypothetical protein